MDPGRGQRRRRWWAAAGVAAGLVAGVMAGVASFTGAAPEPVGPAPTVLHAAPALVRAGRAVDLTLTSVCEDPAAPTCAVVDATAVVTPAGVRGATSVPGSLRAGVLRVRVPAELVPEGGFSYRFVLRTSDGTEVAYPPGGPSAPIRVLTTSGLPTRALARFDWERRVRADGVVVRLPAGAGRGEVGIDGTGEEGGESGPSSFDVTSGGDVLVADWVNGRILRFTERGRFSGQVALAPGDPVDIAAAGDGILVTTLGIDATASELDAAGRVVGRYPVGYGVTSRIVAGAVPRIRVGSGQWIPARAAPGAALGADAQARAQTSTVPLADGSIGVTEAVGQRLAIVWSRPDGSRAGAVIALPGGVLPGADYFVRPLPDGGALAVQGLWDRSHFGVAAIRFDAAARIRAFALLPEPSPRMAAAFSTVRFAAPDLVLMARDAGDGVRIDRFEVR